MSNSASVTAKSEIQVDSFDVVKIVQTSAAVRAASDAHGFWRFAADYLLAARALAVKIHQQRGLFFPVLQLNGLSIELSLKAFLLARGKGLPDLRRLSHDLDAALTLARRHKLGREVRLDPREIAAIKVLNLTYSTHELRYIRVGVARVPQLVYVEGAAKELVLGLELLCTGQKGRLDQLA